MRLEERSNPSLNFIYSTEVYPAYTMVQSAVARREFLRFLALSPLAAQESMLNLMEFEDAARKALPPAHFGYLATGVDDERTLHENDKAYARIRLRPRRLVDVSKIDASVDLFGTRWPSPIFLCPCGSQRAYNPEGELATARAGASRKTLNVLSTMSSFSVEEVAKAAGGPVWYQIYPTTSWAATEKMVHRAEAAGCPVLAITVDIPAGRNTETQKRSVALDSRKCTTCHASRGLARKPMFEGLQMDGVKLYNSAFTWESVRRMRAMTKMKIVLKGIDTIEDAKIAADQGADGIIVSNHGGRAEDSGRATIDCLAEVVEGVRGTMPVLVDGGVRRGTDVFKALALGARAVGIGRPYLWGLAAFGQSGVEKVIDILRAEFELAMAQCGTRSVADIKRSHIAV